MTKVDTGPSKLQCLGLKLQGHAEPSPHSPGGGPRAQGSVFLCLCFSDCPRAWLFATYLLGGVEGAEGLRLERK